MEHPRILHMLTPLKHMSPFDVNMALDAGFDAAGEAPDVHDFDALAHVARVRGVLPEALSDTQLRRIIRVQRAIGRGARAFEPKPGARPVTLLRAQDDRMFAHLGPRLGWPEDGRSWRTLPVSGDHHSCLVEPHVRQLAEVIRDVLHEADARAPSEPARPPAHACRA